MYFKCGIFLQGISFLWAPIVPSSCSWRLQPYCCEKTESASCNCSCLTNETTKHPYFHSDHNVLLLLISWAANNFTGFGQGNFKANAGPSFQTGENFFTVFGVFFPTATGICAGINMSGDLKDPKKSIPTGTLSALGVSAALYLLFALLLGATCTREALQENYNIAEVVSFYLSWWIWLLHRLAPMSKLTQWGPVQAVTVPSNACTVPKLAVNPWIVLLYRPVNCLDTLWV